GACLTGTHRPGPPRPPLPDTSWTSAAGNTTNKDWELKMESFTVHTGIVAVLDRDNVDTDQIIPNQFLKRIERTGYGDVLFFDWRFDAQGKPNPTFSLNAPQYAGASILLAGKNFGCGSSREH